MAFLGTASAVMAASVVGHAGAGPDNAATCQKNADSSGSCTGTLYGFRHTSNGGDMAEFDSTALTNSTNNWYFSATLSGVTYTCSVPSSSTALVAMGPSVLAWSGWFSLHWNSSGSCTMLTLENGSFVYPY
jgi:hypothetical protein